MNTIVIGEPKICIVKGGGCKRIYRDGEFQEICEKKNISEGKSPYRIRAVIAGSVHELLLI
jgi:hypothetical protein